MIEKTWKYIGEEAQQFMYVAKRRTTVTLQPGEDTDIAVIVAAHKNLFKANFEETPAPAPAPEAPKKKTRKAPAPKPEPVAEETPPDGPPVGE